MTAIVRPAALADLRTLVDFTAAEAMDAEAADVPLRTLEQGIRVALEDPTKAQYWVLIDPSEKAVGSMSLLKEWSDWNAGYYWWIQSMYIVPSHRGRGYMSAMLEAALEHVQRERGLELRLYVHTHNQRALRAYAKAGFVASDYRIMTHPVSP